MTRGYHHADFALQELAEEIREKRRACLRDGHHFVLSRDGCHFSCSRECGETRPRDGYTCTHDDPVRSDAQPARVGGEP